MWWKGEVLSKKVALCAHNHLPFSKHLFKHLSGAVTNLLGRHDTYSLPATIHMSVQSSTSTLPLNAPHG